jgi:hypothetical protein
MFFPSTPKRSSAALVSGTALIGLCLRTSLIQG